VRPIAAASAVGATRFGPSFGDSSSRRHAEEFGQLVVSRAEQAVVARQLAEVGEIAGGMAQGAHEVTIVSLKLKYNNFSIGWSDFYVWGLFALRRGAAKAGRVARHTMACVVAAVKASLSHGVLVCIRYSQQRLLNDTTFSVPDRCQMLRSCVVVLCDPRLSLMSSHASGVKMAER
jgi:hypothetical protein